MGCVVGGIPHDLALRIRDAGPCPVFIETGSYQGDTAAWAAGHFDRVLTIEVDPERQREVATRLSGFKHVQCLCGDSRAVLRTVLSSLDAELPLIWLDAHVCGSEHEDAPLLDEIALINRYCPRAAVLIDDARFILAPDGGRRICTLDALIKALELAVWDRYLAIFQDVVIVVPRSLRDVVDSYCTDQTLRLWDEMQVRLKWKQSLTGRVLHRLHRLVGSPIPF